jgi:hypothetical protein
MTSTLPPWFGNFFNENEPYIEKVLGSVPGNVHNSTPQPSTDAEKVLKLIFMA